MALPERQRPHAISGRQACAVVVAAIVATAVLPPAGASYLSQRRIARGHATAQLVATRLRADRGSVEKLARTADVVCGSGRLPKPGPATQDWFASPMTVEQVYGVDRPQDPWGRCYLMNVGALANGLPVLVVSAGPDSVLDTPLHAPAAVGDDIAVRVW